jgi:carnitine-CoA ligase
MTMPAGPPPRHADPRFPPEDEVILPQIIRRNAGRYPARVFAVFEDGTQWTYRELAQRVWRRANGLIRLGVRPGDYVSCWLPTGPAALEAWFAVNAAGATYAPINIAYKGSLLEHAVGLAGARVLIAHVELADRLAGLSLPGLETVVLAGHGEVDLPGRQVVRWDDVAGEERCPGTVDDLRVWHDMALIMTSGTTGPSKGVRCSYLNHYVDSVLTVHPAIGASDRFFLCIPMFHVGGTKSTYTMLRRAGSVAVKPSFSTSSFWVDVRRLGVTTCFLMSAMTTFLKNAPAQPGDRDNPLRTILTGPLAANIGEFCERFGVQVYSNFGMTEMPAIVRTELNPADHRSCGQLTDPDRYQARIVDEFDQELPPGQVGELIVRHDWPWALNSGYKDNPEATAAAWRNGWFHTGDAHYRDASGNFYFVDRLTDTLRRRGENISSMEVEAEVEAHPEIEHAACAGVLSETLDDEVMIWAVRAAGSRLSAADLIDFLEPRLPYFMIPRYVEFCDELPRSPSFKVEKFRLRQRGVTDQTWDRVAVGRRLGRQQLTQNI